MSDVSITNKVKGTQATIGKSVPFSDIKNAVLGADYDLSLAFVDEAEARDVSIRTKQKDYVPNVLSFPLSDAAGEIIICPAEAARTGFSVAELFIHGLCHLKGMDHGATMEKTEETFRRQFGIKDLQ
jgi:ssRNA-specific RNase YbeY (16S rRNA maturation enzyme)